MSDEETKQDFWDAIYQFNTLVQAGKFEQASTLLRTVDEESVFNPGREKVLAASLNMLKKKKSAQSSKPIAEPTPKPLAMETHPFFSPVPSPATSNQPVSNHTGKTISFVTSVFNRFWQLKDTLPKNLEVVRNVSGADLVIVDFGGQDSGDIQNFIESEFSFDCLSGKLKYFRLTQPWTKFHMASAKNSAARLSRGDFIFSLDADNYITQLDIQVISEHFQAKPDSILHQTTGPAPMLHDTWKPYELFEKSSYHGNKLTWDGTSGRIGTSRKTFDAINGYNENFVGLGMDDIDFLIRGIKSGFKYSHVTISRPATSIFIDNGSAEDEHTHDENNGNWAIMDETLKANALYAIYQPVTPIELFIPYEPSCIGHSAQQTVTLFSSVFRCDDYIERLSQDITNILTSPIKISLWILDIVGSHTSRTSQRLRQLASMHSSVFYIPVHKDPGLYNCWNVALKRIRSEFVSNLNIDDIRGPGWLKACLSDLQANLCDVSSPVTCPFSDNSLTNYNAFFNGPEKRTTWFNDRIKFTNDNPTPKYEKILSGYYDHTDMFQIDHDRHISSYCIPNASSVWRRNIHDVVGYFDEDKYGSFSDLAVWLNASYAGFRFKQNQYKVLFYLSEDQAHKRQKTQQSQLRGLVSKFGDPAYKKLAALNAFDHSMNDGSYGDHHLLGWNWVRDEVEKTFHHQSDGILLDLFVERTFYWWKKDPKKEFEFTRPWVGFIHTTPHESKTYDLDAQNLNVLIQEERFINSLDHCLGLIVLSQDNLDYLRPKLESLGFNIPLYALFHPNIPVTKTSLETISASTGRPKIFHVGAHLRSFSSFAKLDFDKSEKVLLVPRSANKETFIETVVNRELSESGLGSINDYVEHIYYAPNDEYQAILNHGIIFNDYLQPAGSNLISEAISAKSMLVLNRHAAFEEYLGHEYPLFYDSIDHANALIHELYNGTDLMDKTRSHLAMMEQNFSCDKFCTELENITREVLRKSI